MTQHKDCNHTNNPIFNEMLDFLKQLVDGAEGKAPMQHPSEEELLLRAKAIIAKAEKII